MITWREGTVRGRVGGWDGVIVLEVDTADGTLRSLAYPDVVGAPEPGDRVLLNVTALDYEAYPSAAEKMLARVGAEAVDQWPEVRIAISHRTGHLLPGEASVIIACASPHRENAYAASSFAITRIKEIVPIWKKEWYEDGSSWIGSELDYQIETGRIDSSEIIEE